MNFEFFRKIHTAVNKVTHANCSVWVVERKPIEQIPKLEAIWNVLKQDATHLSTLRFPLIVNVSKPLEDLKNAIVFETEPITTSLSAILESKFALDELEIKLGLIQLCEALNFVHSTAQQVHLNLTPNSVMICHPDWKLAGFAFAVMQNQMSGTKRFYDPTPATSFSSDKSKSPVSTVDLSKPSLDYMAPEVALMNSISPSADMFALGCLIYELYWLCHSSSSSSSGDKADHTPKKLLNTNGNVDTYRRAVEDLVGLNMDHIPRGLRKSLDSLLSSDPSARPTAEELLKTDYFNDTAVKILQYLSHINEHDDRSKADFLKGLRVALTTMTFSTKLLETKILPPLITELRNAILVPLLLPNLFLIAEMIEKNAGSSTAPPRNGIFSRMIYPAISPLVSIPEPFQTVVILLQKLDFMSKRIPEQQVAKSLAPMACQALDHTNGAVVVLALKEILPLLPYFDHETIRTSLTPRVLTLVHSPKTPQVMRVQALFCMSKLIPFAARQFIETSILPSVLRTLEIDRSPTTITSVAGVCDIISLKFGTDYTARNILPSLIPVLIDPGLARKQFETLLTILNGMIGRIAEGERKKFDEMEARAANTILTNQSVSDAEKLAAFSAQLPPVASTISPSSSGHSIKSNAAGSSGKTSPTSTQLPLASTSAAGIGSNTRGPNNDLNGLTGLASNNAGGQLAFNTSTTTTSTISLLTPTVAGPKEDSKGDSSDAKGAAAFNALLTSQAQRRNALNEHKEKNTLIDEDEGFQGTTGTTGTSAVSVMPFSAPVASDNAFSSDIFSLDTTSFNFDTLGLAPTSSSEAVSNQDLSSMFGTMLTSLAPSLQPYSTPSQPSNSQPTSLLQAPTNPVSLPLPPGEYDDFFNPRAAPKPALSTPSHTNSGPIF